MANADRQVKSMVRKGEGQNDPTLLKKVKEYSSVKIADVEIPTVILENGEPFLPWRIFVEEGLKADWRTQRRKEQELKEKGCSILELPFKTKGGMQKMKAISLFDIPAYLYTISVNKVRQELREKIRQMQVETTHAIREYWKNKIKKEREEIEKLKEEYNKLVKELRNIPTYEEYRELKMKYDLLLTMVDMIVMDMENAQPYINNLFGRIKKIKEGVPILTGEGDELVKKIVKFK